MDAVKRVLSFLFSKFTLLPLAEVAFTLIVSNAALIFLIFAYMLETKGAVFSRRLAFSVISHNFTSGEMLVYLLAIVAPTLWVMLSNWRAKRHPVFYSILLILQIALISTSAYIYGKSKYGGISNGMFAEHWSVYCFIVGVTIWYITLIYQKWLPTVLEPSPPQSGKRIMEEL